MNAIPLINNIPKTNINNEKQLRQEINTSLVALKKEAGTLEGLINEAAQMLVTINNRIATLENDTVKKSDIVDVVQSGNLQPVTSNAVSGAISALDVSSVGGSGKYISAISETDGKINATATDLATSIASGGTIPPTSGAVYNALQDKKCVHSVKVNYQNPRTIPFGNWGFGLCMGNIDGAGNFAFYFAKSGSNSVAISNLTSLGNSFLNATLRGNTVTIGAENYRITITFNQDYTVTISWAGAIQGSTIYGRMAFISGNTIL